MSPSHTRYVDLLPDTISRHPGTLLGVGGLGKASVAPLWSCSGGWMQDTGLQSSQAARAHCPLSLRCQVAVTERLHCLLADLRQASQ